MTVHLMQILLVEDSAADVRLTQEALKDAKILNELHVARDGVQAMDFLAQRGDHAGAPRPDIVILDLNLPRKDGKEVLAEMKGDPDLRSIPVAVLTTSDAEADVLESYDLGANCFLTKPVDLDQFLKVVRAVEEFWLGMVRLPEREDTA
ncbi:response regulator [Acidimicrobiia bacterium EGI L10123]|uniref:response regulator n=1 Tax=Salinilacustrithrix flava TaxID=2957203 RepID=UPI003D7C24F3|nr:response regulator [Acidimicrobiia bacterium EGI L10123]